MWRLLGVLTDIPKATLAARGLCEVRHEPGTDTGAAAAGAHGAFAASWMLQHDDADQHTHCLRHEDSALDASVGTSGAVFDVVSMPNRGKPPASGLRMHGAEKPAQSEPAEDALERGGPEIPSREDREEAGYFWSQTCQRCAALRRPSAAASEARVR